MTSEVALMNRSAVALAADSAATVTYWNPDKAKHEQRFFKRVNKIFNIVSNKPVGLMVYGTGSLQGMPWEVLAKAYRDDHVGQGHEMLPAYADDFFKYLADTRDIFPEDQQQRALLSAISESMAALSYSILFDDAYKAESDAQKKADLATDMVNVGEGNIYRRDYINDVAKAIHDEINQALQPYIDHVLQSEEGKFFVGEVGQALVDRLIPLAIARLFKADICPLDQTGVVVAGYGEKQYMPQLEQFTVYGLFKNKLIYTRLARGCRSITFDNTSDLVPIAQSNMINTFFLGADVPTLEEIDSYVGKAIEEFRTELVTAGHLLDNVDTTPMSTNATTAFTTRVRRYIQKEHTRPLRLVIGMLSPEELGDLAETLVSAESLKERVTRPTESVSGPVDVAVISKSDGFIWIKRKHYFDPSLNLRFVAKRQQEVKEEP